MGNIRCSTKCPAIAWQKFANLRLLLTYHATVPGKKLNFMGNEIGQGREWSEKRELDWSLLEFDFQHGIKQLSEDLNKLYRENPALHELDFAQEGFQWIDCHDADHSIVSFIRRGRTWPICHRCAEFHAGAAHELSHRRAASRERTSNYLIATRFSIQVRM